MSDAAAIADELAAAYATATQIPPVSARYAGFDVPAGYAVLERLHAWRVGQGWRPIGRKIGFTNFTLWERYGVDRPMWSHVWDRTVRFAEDGCATLSLHGLMEPRVEPEVVFRLKSPLPPGRDPRALLEAIEWIAPGFEIVHSPFPGWRFTAADCAAAFGLHGGLAIGTPVAIDARDADAWCERLATFEARLYAGERLAETGGGANVLGSPLNALLHLRDALASQPRFPPLAPGEIVTTGTLTDAWPVRAGETWRSDYGTLGLAGLRLELR